MISEETIYQNRNFNARVSSDGRCKIMYRNLVSGDLGKGRATAQYRVVPGDDDLGETFTQQEIDFWKSINIAPGTDTFPCIMYPVRANELKLGAISEDKTMVWIDLPWYLYEVDRYRSQAGRLNRFVSQIGAVDIIAPIALGIYQIEQLMDATPGRINHVVLATQVQTR